MAYRDSVFHIHSEGLYHWQTAVCTHHWTFQNSVEEATMAETFFEAWQRKRHQLIASSPGAAGAEAGIDWTQARRTLKGVDDALQRNALRALWQGTMGIAANAGCARCGARGGLQHVLRDCPKLGTWRWRDENQFTYPLFVFGTGARCQLHGPRRSPTRQSMRKPVSGEKPVCLPVSTTSSPRTLAP